MFIIRLRIFYSLPYLQMYFTKLANKIKASLKRKDKRAFWWIIAVAVVALVLLVPFFNQTGVNLSWDVMSLSSSTGYWYGVNSCTETDNGRNYAVKWSNTYVLNGVTRRDSDICVSNSAVKELFCMSGILYAETKNCGTGATCTDGACRPIAWDLIIGQMSISPNGITAVLWSNYITTRIKLGINNIGNWPVNIPMVNSARRFYLACTYDNGAWWLQTTSLWIGTLQAGQSVTTYINLTWTNDYLWLYNVLGLRYIKCVVMSQQQQLWPVTNPNDTSMPYESNWTNNSYLLKYKVVQ